MKLALPLSVMTGSIRSLSETLLGASTNINKKTASRPHPETLNHAHVCSIIGFQGTELHALNTDYLRYHCVPLDGDSSSLLRGGKCLMESVFSEEERRELSDN